MASSLPRRCSTTELQQRLWSDDRAPGSTTPCSRKAGAGRGNRTLTTSLEGWSSTVELHPLIIPPPHRGKRGRSRNLDQREREWWAELDSNQRRRSHQIYSLVRLTASVTTQFAGGRNRPIIALDTCTTKARPRSRAPDHPRTHKPFRDLELAVGLEPTTSRLQIRCSAN